jgi:hypothetical protein
MPAVRKTVFWVGHRIAVGLARHGLVFGVPGYGLHWPKYGDTI